VTSSRPGRGVRSRAVSALAVAIAAALLAGCSMFGSLFSAEKPKPKELEPIVAPITVRPVWNQRVGVVQFPLTVAVNGNVLTLAASDGSVVAIEADSGRVVWRAEVGAKISAGVGSDGTLAAVVTRDGELVALEGGRIKWKKVVGVRVATAPLVAGGRIFVLGVDRTIHAFDASDGIRLWQVQRPGDALTLSQTGVIVAFKNTLVVGQGPRMAGFDPVTSSLRWEAPLGSPRGANEVERLADLIGPVVRSGDLICARSFQAAVGCVDAQLGNVAWTKNVGGTDAISGDAELLFGADASDRINAWRTPTGETAWTSEALMFRGLGAPGTVGQSVAFGDSTGTLHWFSRAKGESQARVTTDGSAITTPPVSVGGLLVVVTRDGGVFAFRPA
jgi:outer membrane protein assembly factor BamB